MHELLATTLDQVLGTLTHNWPFLAAGAVIAAALAVYVDQARVARLFRAHGAASVALATAVAIATPLCSCGTMAVLLGMMASSVPWAPIVAFMAASPLTSPEETIIAAGMFGWPFALTLLVASGAIGLGAGAAAHVLEGRGWLAGQVRAGSPRRFAPGAVSLPAAARPAPAACCAAAAVTAAPSAPACCAAPALSPCCGAASAAELAPRGWSPSEAARALRLDALARELLRSAPRLLVMFLGFAFVGYLVNNLIPRSWVAALFGRGADLGVPLAALLGLPLYVNSDASLPLIRSFVENGAGAGAALAFTITGAGTSLGAIGGALTIARWRVVGLVVGTLLAGAVAAGYALDLVLAR